MHTPSSDEVLCVHESSSAFQDLHEACSQACWKWPAQMITITSWTNKKKEKLQCYLGKFAILVVFLSVQEPIRDFVLTGVSHNGDELLYLDLDKNSKSLTWPYKNSVFSLTSSSESSPARLVKSMSAFLRTTFA